MNICATIILYRPSDEIFSNIDSYITEVNKIIVIDNSEVINQVIHDKLLVLYSPHIEIIYKNKNLGIATALNIACDRAIELNYDWILTMDQDSRFINFGDYIKCLSKHYDNQYLAILAANTQWNAIEHLKEKTTCNFEEKFLAITSANFLNLKLFNKIGRFEDKLFIDMVDHDYCIKANFFGYKIYYLEDIMVEHSLGNLFLRKNFLTRKFRKKIEHNAQRNYYITRNYLYTWKKYSSVFPKEFNLFKTMNILFIHEITKILLYEDHKLKKIYAKFLGLLHFLIGKYGKYDL